jgi:hypothetical protein
MTTSVANSLELNRLLSAAALRRGVVAGVAWGLSLAAAMTALSAWQCGGICIDEAAWTTATALAAGLATMGPLAAFGRRS